MKITNQLIEEAVERLRAKVRKLVKENVRYLVSDPKDIRVGILAQQQMEDWVVALCRQELSTIASKSGEERDWEMLLSEIQLEVGQQYITKSLDSSDQSKWGDEYKGFNEIKTDVHNNAIRIATESFVAKLLKALETNNTKE